VIRRVLMSTIHDSHPQRGMRAAFDALFGAGNVQDFDYLDWVRRGNSPDATSSAFERYAIDVAPDWIWLQVQDSKVLRPDMLARVKEALPRCVMTHWNGDMRETVSEYAAAVSRVCDLTLLSSSGQVAAFHDAGAQCQYVQIGLDWEEDVLGLPEWTPPFHVPDVVFIGNHYEGAFRQGTEERLSALRTLRDAGVDVGVVGTGWPADIRTVGQCHVKQQHHVWKRAKVALNVNHFNHVEGYYSDRQLIAMASGTPVVCYEVPGLRREFTDTVDCMMFRSNDELVRKTRWLLDRPESAVQIGAAGRAEVIRNHTWFTRILRLLPDVEQIQTQRRPR